MGAIDARPAGDPERSSWQKQVAAAISETPDLLDDPRVRPYRQRLVVWVRLLPHLLSDDEEAAISVAERPLIEAAVAQLGALEGDGATSSAACDTPLTGLDSDDVQERASADRASWAVCGRRALSAADALSRLIELHVRDDGRRGFSHWLSRIELVHGVRTGELEDLLALHDRLAAVAQQWLAARHGAGPVSFHDRRYLAGSRTRNLADDVHLVERVFRSNWPSLAGDVSVACGAVRAGPISECRSDSRGRPVITVHHRGGLRSTLVVGHEVSHGVHLLRIGEGGAPNAFVGEGMASVGALLVALSLSNAVEPGLSAAVLGDHLVEEIVLGLAVARFEDEVRRAAGAIDRTVLDAAWLDCLRAVYEPTIAVPDSAAIGWARLAELGTTPGHSLAYVWANLLAVLAMEDGRSAEPGLTAGAIDASELASLLAPGRDVARHGADAFGRLMLRLADDLR